METIEKKSFLNQTKNGEMTDLQLSKGHGDIYTLSYKEDGVERFVTMHGTALIRFIQESNSRGK